MDSFMTRMLASFTVCMVLKEGCGLPLSEVPVQEQHLHHIRTKRCSCNNWDDKECIYFCHLDIIWVNTPSKLLPYGLGGSSSRRRRSANRCECHNPADKNCRGFCHKSSEENRTHDSSPLMEPPRKKSKEFLAFLRSVVQSNMEIAKGFQTSKRSSSVGKN